MNSSKTCSIDRICASVFLAVVFFVSAWPAYGATTCPATETHEQGQHCRFDHANGFVHAWTPPNYDSARAGIVVYVHGNTGDNNATWTSDQLAKQFRASNANALFIVPESPKSGSDPVKWRKLSDLLGAVENAIDGSLPSGQIVVIGHSNAIRTTKLWAAEGHPRLSHIIGLDTMYEGKSQYQNWLKQPGHRMTLVGIEGTPPFQNAIDVTRSVSDHLILGVEAEGRYAWPSSFSGLPVKAGTVQALYLESNHGHHDMPENQIAFLLARAQPEGTESVTAVNLPSSSDIVIEPPRLNVPIPEVSFSGGANFLAEYIAGVYTFLISTVGVIAGIMIMIGGFQYLTAGGDAARSGSGKKRIANAVIGLILAFGSYGILYLIDPDFVDFGGLDVTIVQTEQFNTGPPDEDFDAYIPSETPGEIPQGSAQPVCRSVSRCRSLCDQGSSNWPEKAPGMLDPDLANPIPAMPGVVPRNGTRAHPAVIAGLRRAGQIAQTIIPGKPLWIFVSDGYRPLERQMRSVCRRFDDLEKATASGDQQAIAKAQRRVDTIGTAVAWPGGSNHGAGTAVDLMLWENEPSTTGRAKSGERWEGLLICSGCFDVQSRDVFRENSKLFDRIMTQAGFRRYAKEIWHYELGSTSGCRCTHPDCPWPPGCS